MSRAIQTLEQEHRLIEKVLGSLARFADDLAGAGEPIASARERAADYARFFRDFADRCHHGKEEARLFVALSEHGLAREGGPIGVMLHEHEQGRRLVRQLAEIGSGKGPLSAAERAAIVAIARAFVPLLRQHIQKEDGVLFPAATRILPPVVLERLRRDFEAFERDEMGDGVHEELHGVAEALLAVYPPESDSTKPA